MSTTVATIRNVFFVFPGDDESACSFHFKLTPERPSYLEETEKFQFQGSHTRFNRVFNNVTYRTHSTLSVALLLWDYMLLENQGTESSIERLRKIITFLERSHSDDEEVRLTLIESELSRQVEYHKRELEKAELALGSFLYNRRRETSESF